ncbi:MAG: 1-phosphofructokinase family hexose kinase [Acidobacteria bacterium]|nr:1-phosphofructokinase family hexose kinase [Acidobacteriota bacterium]MBS1865154.1 1-phosphofructokinase family hexose kinase [Acidobacteriota bacterium]
MFLCVSPNPAIDKRLTIPTLLAGEIHRARSVHSFPGGKATHVAMVLRTLGETPHWIGPCGGASGEELIAGLRALGIEPHISEVKGKTRTNLELIDDAGKVTEILEPGPELSADELDRFERACRKLFEKYQKSAFVLFSGSLPAGAPADLYARLIDAAKQEGCKTFLDAGGEALLGGIEAGPDFVKPNAKEAAAALNMQIDSVRSAATAIETLCELGARSAAISLGKDGLVYRDGAGRSVLWAAAVELKAKSTVGAGDSALAGFAKGIASGLSAEETLRQAVACAAANCIAESPGAARLTDIEKFRKQVKVQTVGAKR